MGFVYQGLFARTRQHFVLLVPGEDRGMDTSNIHTCTQICLTSNTHSETPYFLNLTNITISHSLPNSAVTKLQYLWLLWSLPVRLMEGSLSMPNPQRLRQTVPQWFVKNPSPPQNSAKHLMLGPLRFTLDWQWPWGVLKSLRNWKWLMKFTEEFWVVPFDLMYCSELKNSLIGEQSICNWHSWGQWPWWPLESIPGTFASENILCVIFQMLSSKVASRTFPPSHRVNTSMLSLALASNGLPVSGVKRDFPPEALPWPLSVWNSQSEHAR